ncbi:hypothetical protein V5799_010321 [Amblyomma americanum]|uniref:Uncharacterized protein n=1 Tax=Amblyomma americanum TaxID=6943 RepID=A0AAQ4F804_AMBAM
MRAPNSIFYGLYGREKHIIHQHRRHRCRQTDSPLRGWQPNTSQKPTKTSRRRVDVARLLFPPLFTGAPSYSDKPNNAAQCLQAKD